MRDGIELWATTGGCGPPTLCVHGGPGLWDYLGGLADTLHEVSALVRFDQRGCGRSGGTAGPFTIEQAISDLDDIRAWFGHERCTILGHSWGAELALRYASRHPDRAAGVVYIAGTGHDDGFHRPYAAERKRRLGAQSERVAELSAIPWPDRTSDEERERCVLLWETDFAPGPAATEHARALWGSKPLDAVVNMTANRELPNDGAAEDLRRIATRVTCPVTMIFGREDPRPWNAADGLFDAIPDAQRIVLDGAGHFPWVEQPTETVRAIRAAISGPSGHNLH